MRLRTHLRIAFHDWMWSEGDGTPLRRLARRLPTYFTDPYLDGMRTERQRRRLMANSEPVTLAPGPVRVVASPGLVATTPQTWTTGVGQTIWIRPHDTRW